MTSQDYKLEVIRAHLSFDHPTWTSSMVFEQAINQSGMKGGFARTEAQTPNKAGQDPRIAEELRRHTALRESRQTPGDHVKRLQRIRQKMVENPAMTFDSAFSAICREEQAQPAAASVAPKAVATRPKSYLVTGGFYNLLPGMAEDEE
jgi:hypothetical protein